MRRYRFGLLQAVGLAGLLALWEGGTLQVIIAADESNLTAFIALCAVAGLFYAFRGDWEWVRWISDRLPTLGFAGTCIGFMFTFLNVDWANVQDLERLPDIVDTLVSGMGIALTTTLVGLLLSLWLDLTEKLCKDTSRP